MQFGGGATRLPWATSAICVAILLSWLVRGPAAPRRRTKNSSLFTCLDARTGPWFTVSFEVSGLRFCLAHLRIIHLDSGPIFECLQDLVTAGDDFIVFFETVFHLDISGAGQASVHFAKFSLVRRGYYEHALNFVGVLLHLRDRSSLAGFALAALRFKIFLVTHSQRLDWNGERVFGGASGDLGGGRKSGPQVGRRIIKGNHHFEVLGFLAAGCALLTGDAGGTHNGVVANFGYFAFESFSGNGINGDFRGLSNGHIHDVSFINVNFSRDH